MTTFKAMMWKALGAFLLACPAVATAAPLKFDCDVPPNHFSSVSEDVNGPMTVSGTIQPVQMRSGDNLPVAGVRFISADEKNGAGFQLVASSARAKQLSIVLNTRINGELKQASVGQIGAGETIPFRFTLSEPGKAVLVVGGATFSADFLPMSTGKGVAFCSTGQFKFSDLEFAGNGAPAITSP